MENTFKENNTYWANNGKYQDYQNEMWELIPSNGEVKIKDNKDLETALENLRQINRLYYDFYNNGCCNVVDIERETCQECNGSGWADDDDDDDLEDDCYYCNGDCYVDGEAYITDYYDDFVHNLERYTGMKLEPVLIKCGSNYGSYGFPNEDCEILEKVTDKVMELSWKTYQEHKNKLTLIN